MIEKIEHFVCVHVSMLYTLLCYFARKTPNLTYNTCYHMYRDNSHRRKEMRSL